MALQRTHILLEPEQQKALIEIAHREGRSVSEVTREIVQQGIQQRKQEYTALHRRRLEALQNARRLSAAIQQELGEKSLEIDVDALLQQLREERDNESLNGPTHRD